MPRGGYNDGPYSMGGGMGMHFGGGSFGGGYGGMGGGFDSDGSGKIFVGRLGQEVTADHLRDYFKKFGRLVDVYLPKVGH